MHSIIAAGHLNNQILANDQERLLIKGRSYKITRPKTYQEPLPDGRIRETYLETEVVMTDITTIDGAGHIVNYSGAELPAFLQKWLTPLTNRVAQDYPPIGWEHAYDYGGPAGHRYGSKGFGDIYRTWGTVLSAPELLSDPAGSPPFTPQQIVALQQRGIRCPTCGETQFRGGRPLAVSELKTATWTCSNDTCRSPLYQFVRRRSSSQIRGSFQLYAKRERVIRNYTDKGEAVPFPMLETWQGCTVKDTFGHGKVPLAGYIKQRGKGQLDLLIVDEVHQYKGFDSDQGYAMHHLAQAAKKVVALTGTIYGGKASSLFHLLFRLSPEMCRTYIEPTAIGQRRLRSRDWVASYGILQQIETRTLDESGRQTANSRSNVRYKELPGGSPAMLPWLLNRSVFLSLGDMGFPLPKYREIPVSVPMAPAQTLHYENLKTQLKEELKERLVRGDKSLLAGYLYALLFWPDSPRRPKVVSCPRTGRVVASAPALLDDFVGPKETEIIQLCLQEKARVGQTRPVKVYYFAYEDTLQTDALHLVAAKVAATLRINGDTVGNDSLAELDNLTSGDLVATLAKIVTGETQLPTHNLQQAFAQANANLQQANRLIGRYEPVSESTSAMVERTLVNGNGIRQERQHTLFVNGKLQGDGLSENESIRPKPIPPTIPKPRFLL